MCEFGVFPIFSENDLLQLDKILGLTFFKARKDFEGFKNGVLPFTIIVNGRTPFSIAEFCARCIVYSSRLFA